MKKKGKKIGFNLEEEYRESWDYLKESQNFIYIIVGVFLISALMGFFISVPDAIAGQILKFIQELIEKIQGMNQNELINFIFFNNLQSSLFGMILGVFLGIFPIIVIIANGYLLGFVASISVGEEGVSILWGLLPHGIFELPAVFISLGLGLKLGTFIFKEEKIQSLKRYFWNSLRIFLFIVLPLLIIAAIIEGSFIFLSG